MGWAHLDDAWPSIDTLDLLFQVLTLFLLSTPHVLCRKAELDVPLLSPVFSLLFYLIFLVLSAIHVLVCTSSESSCYLCSLPWLAVGGVMVLVSALLCVIVSALIRMVIDGTLLKKVWLGPGYIIWSLWVGFSFVLPANLSLIRNWLKCTSTAVLEMSWKDHTPSGLQEKDLNGPSQASGHFGL